MKDIKIFLALGHTYCDSTAILFQERYGATCLATYCDLNVGTMQKAFSHCLCKESAELSNRLQKKLENLLRANPPPSSEEQQVPDIKSCRRGGKET